MGWTGGLLCQHGELINRKWHRHSMSSGAACEEGRGQVCVGHQSHSESFSNA